MPGPYLFRSFDKDFMSPYDGTSSATVVDALLSSAAAPGTFHEHTIASIDTFVDGGVGYNNPAQLAILEAMSITGAHPRLLVSVGCGSYPPSPHVSGFKLAAVAGSLGEQVSNSEDTHIFLKSEAAHWGMLYYRLNVIFETRVELNSSSPQDVVTILSETRRSLELELGLLPTLTSVVAALQDHPSESESKSNSGV